MSLYDEDTYDEELLRLEMILAAAEEMEEDEEPAAAGVLPLIFAVRPRVPFHPHPVPCRGCGFILQATYAAANGYRCPGCRRPVCYVCGCTEDVACRMTETAADGSKTAEYACAWCPFVPGTCTFCYARAAYEYYQDVNGQPADDPHYLAGPSARAFKGLAHGL